jgi:hypothetical protein
MRYRLNLSYWLLFLAVSAGGQNQPCELDIPLNIVMPDVALVRNMHQDGFIAHRGGEVLPIRSVNEDTAPRRIVVVVENGKNVNPGARKVEVSILGVIVKNARAEDSFALLTAIGPRRELPFGAPRETLLSAIAELSSPAKGSGQGKSALDAVLEAAGSLQPAQPGDSIILFTMGPALGEASYGRVGKTLVAAGIRLFGFQLGRVYAGIYSMGVTPSPGGGVLPRATVDPNRQTMFDLADETGGFFLGENTEGDPQRSYQLSDERLRQLDKFGGQLYKGIVQYYRIRLASATDDFTFDLNDSLRQKFSKAHLIYPRKVPRCSPANTANPSPVNLNIK